ncbi:MAG: threonine/serine dehydratase [Sneathiellales bacterium]|nr:threonine/serine dehydratase [Sneathiellales bacterium]
MPDISPAPSFNTVQEAYSRLEGVVVRTPLLESPALNEKLGGRLFLKCEALQKTGSFKFRGAYNAISTLSEMQRRQGVFAFSSGNHAQGMAYAAKILGCKATILMPEDTPRIKLENTRGYGATVVTYDRYTESREEIGETIASEQNLTLIRPYDNVQVISGQGTCGIEIAQQLEEKNLTADLLSAPCGGGGLMSGISLALSKLSPKTEIYVAEPENFDDTTRSLASGTRQSNSGDHRSICDAIVTPTPGNITFPVLHDLTKGGLVVSEAEVAQAMRAAFQYFKIVAEPGGSVALAAFLSGKIDMKGKTVVAVASGGNVDTDLYAKVLNCEI